MNMLKYPGGKEKELGLIKKNLPGEVLNYYEPFVGGGSVFLGIDAINYFINDYSADLINLYQCVKKEDETFHQFLEKINTVWKNLDVYAAEDTWHPDGFYFTYIKYRDHLISSEQLEELIVNRITSNKLRLFNLVSQLGTGHENIFIDEIQRILKSKLKRMKVLEYSKKHIPDEDVRKNLLGCFKAAFYMYVRHLYNNSEDYEDGTRAVLYLFIRDMCYSSMFRFNSEGQFNVPYGGISYNQKFYDSTIEKYKNKEFLKKLSDTEIFCMDYKEFLKKQKIGASDFMFVDPPYDSEFSSYDKNNFGADEQKKLANYLIEECPCNFMADIKSTDFIQSLYPEGKICANGKKLRIVYFDKTYSVSFMDRNNRKTEHILIMNY